MAKTKIDLYNLDFSNNFFSPSKSSDFYDINDPSGISVVFNHAHKTNSEFILYLTNNIDSENDRYQYKSMNQYLEKKFNETLYIPTESTHQQKWKAICLSTVCIASHYGLECLRILPYLYQPENTYWMHMTIFEFKSIITNPLQKYFIFEEDKKKLLNQSLKILREANTFVDRNINIIIEKSTKE